MSFLTGIIDNLFPFFTTNNSSSLNKIFNSFKLKILSDLDLNSTFTQSHLDYQSSILDQNILNLDQIE